MDARVESPGSPQDAADLMRLCHNDTRTLRPVGGGTKLAWGQPGPVPDVYVSTKRLERIVEHNAADLTAVLEAGAPLKQVQEVFSEAKQMIPLDPPLGNEEAATIGGVVAAADSGPLRHRYGAPRDLVLGITVALADGTLARAGGKVIKNVAGYDLGKLFAGSFGTLGLIVEVIVRLTPDPRAKVTVVGESDDPDLIARAASDLAHGRFEFESLDVLWSHGKGRVLARCAGGAPERQAQQAASVARAAGVDASTTGDDDRLWNEQRSLQRSSDGVVVRVSGRLADIAKVCGAAERLGATAVGRAGPGLLWLSLRDDAPDELVHAIEELRRRLRPFKCVVLDAPEQVRQKTDVWDEPEGSAVELMRRVKARFDPDGLCSPGVFVAGI